MLKIFFPSFDLHQLSGKNFRVIDESFFVIHLHQFNLKQRMLLEHIYLIIHTKNHTSELMVLLRFS